MGTYFINIEGTGFSKCCDRFIRASKTNLDPEKSIFAFFRYLCLENSKLCHDYKIDSDVMQDVLKVDDYVIFLHETFKTGGMGNLAGNYEFERITERHRVEAKVEGRGGVY